MASNEDPQDKPQYTVEPLQKGAVTPQTSASSNPSKYTVEPIAKGTSNTTSTSTTSKYTVEPVDKPVRNTDAGHSSHLENYGFTVHNVDKNAGDALQSMIAMPGQVYHAFADAPTAEETNKAAKQERDNLKGGTPDWMERVTNPNGTPLGGARRVGLGLTRIIEPGYEHEKQRADEEKAASDKELQEGHGSIPLSTVGHAALSLAHRAASVVPLVGPLAGELADQTFVEGDPGGALAKGVTYYGSGKLMEALPKVNEFIKRGIPVQVPGTDEPAYIKIPIAGHGAQLISETASKLANIPAATGNVLRKISGLPEDRPLIPGAVERLNNVANEAKDPFERRGEKTASVLGGVRADEIKSQARLYAKRLGLSKDAPIDINQALVDEFRRPSADYHNPAGVQEYKSIRKSSSTPNEASGGSPPAKEAIAEPAIPPTKQSGLTKILEEPATLPSKPTTVKPADVQRQVEEALGNKPASSTDPRKAILKDAGATDEELKTILAGGKHGATASGGMSKLAGHFGVDIGQYAIGRAKADIEAGTHIAPADVLQKIIDAGHTPADIAKAVDEGKHLPTIGGGSQEPDIHNIASDYLKDLGRGGNPAAPNLVSMAEKEQPNLRGIGDEAQQYHDELLGKGFEQPHSVEVQGGLGDEQGLINLGGKTESTHLKSMSMPSAIESARVNAAASRIVNERANPVEQQISQLHDIRARLGLGSSEGKPTMPETLGNQQPIAKASESLKARAGGTTYSREVGKLTTKHTVESKSADGKSSARVSAVEQNDRPNEWVVKMSAAAKPGTLAGEQAYAKLADAAQAEATKTGNAVTLRGDAVQSDAAKSTWGKLGTKHGFPVQFDKSGRPSMTLEPKGRSTLPKVLGGPEAKNDSNWLDFQHRTAA